MAQYLGQEKWIFVQKKHFPPQPWHLYAFFMYVVLLVLIVLGVDLVTHKNQNSKKSFTKFKQCSKIL
jgi:hypothetical protein